MGDLGGFNWLGCLRTLKNQIKFVSSWLKGQLDESSQIQPNFRHLLAGLRCNVLNLNSPNLNSEFMTCIHREYIGISRPFWRAGKRHRSMFASPFHPLKGPWVSWNEALLQSR